VRIGVPIGATRSLTADRQTTSIPASNLRQHAKLSLASPVSLGRNVFTRPRTVRSKGCLSNKTALAMIFKLAEAAEKNWRRLDGHNQLPKIILGVRFTDGIEVVKPKAQAAAA